MDRRTFIGAIGGSLVAVPPLANGIEYRSADGKPERLPGLAVELVRLRSDVISAFGGDVAPIAQSATATIPIVA